MQGNIFEMISPRFKFDKDVPIKVFEAFSGVGMQLMALNKLGIKYESVGYSEIDKYAIQSYQAIHQCDNNFGDISKIKGSELPEIDLFTYSFPCTDLSKAGQQKGLDNTRSGLVYEVLRILQELKQLDRLPKVLLMENVVDLVQSKFIKEFNKIQEELEELGYSNHAKVLNALDYGVAQNRQRVFMVSILGDYYYEFPKKIKLEKRLKDYLQPLEEIEEKYFIKDFKNSLKINDSSDELQGGKWDKTHRIGKAVYSENYVCPTINTMQGGNLEPKVKIIANINPSGNGLNGNIYAGELSPTLTTNKGEGIKIAEATKQGYAVAKDGDSVNLEHPNSSTRRGRVGEQQAQTLTTSCNQGVVECFYHNTSESFSRRPLKDKSRTIKCDDSLAIKENYVIRKLTPLECWRLMGISDQDYYKAQEVCSNSQLYKQAGNGIVVDVLVSILNEL